MLKVGKAKLNCPTSELYGSKIKLPPQVAKLNSSEKIFH